MTDRKRLKLIAEIIERVENRCLAVDGPVPKTSDEITDKELRDIYRLTEPWPVRMEKKCPSELQAPVPELKGSTPLVLYFANDSDRDEFMALVEEAKPNMVSRKL